MKAKNENRIPLFHAATTCRGALVLVVTLILAGCQHVRFEDLVHDGAGARGSGSSASHAESAMNRQWQGRRFSELVGELGAPLLLLKFRAAAIHPVLQLSTVGMPRTGASGRLR